MTSLIIFSICIACAIGAIIKMALTHTQADKTPPKKTKHNRRIVTNYHEDVRTLQRKNFASQFPAG